jgi:type II restriction/modification system DNA methylase subunit YeeA
MYWFPDMLKRQFYRMTPAEFIKKWKPVALTERAAAHTHFLDLCKLFEHPDPVSADPTGEWFTFEKGASKTGGGEGFADVWKKNFFAWEYKKKKRDLNAAMDQLVRYAAALENPPLQVVCDTDRFVIRTAWTNTVPMQHEIELDDLALPEKRDILWAVFHDPEKLRPTETRAGVTKEAADKFSTIAARLQGRGTPEDVAHFINQLVFCFFANSVKLLPEGFFPKLLIRAGQKPDKAQEYFNSLFEAMEHGGEFDLTDIAHFNGGLFDGRRAIQLDAGDIGLLVEAGKLDWSLIDPTIFGTLFERFLDPDKRTQIGAHYTDPDKIMMIVEPVILRPLRMEWEKTKSQIFPLAEKAAGIVPRSQSPGDRRAADNASRKLRSQAMELRDAFLHRLANIRILDPACGSGNFLYLALQGVKDLENRVVLECEALELSPRALEVGPEIVHGIEINPFAAELARTTIWIGDIQWRRRNGIYSESPPILRKLEAIECRDALMTKLCDGSLVDADWPSAEFIIGNPPFLGGKLMRSGLGDDYVDCLLAVYRDRVAGEADLVVYWFEKTRALMRDGNATRVGFVSTNSIRGGANRRVLEKISEEARVFEAWSDEEWVVEGAAVRVSIVCFGEGNDPLMLDGRGVSVINADLTSSMVDLIKAKRLTQNAHTAFMGDTKGGAFDVPGDMARNWLKLPVNPNGKKNEEVLRPWRNGLDVTRRSRDMWIIDFGWDLSEKDAALFEAPFTFAEKKIKPFRVGIQGRGYARRWWVHERPRPEMWAKIAKLDRYIITPRVSKHRLFVWAHNKTCPDSATIAIARDDDAFFGILHSRFHELWSLRLGTWLGVGNDPRYTPTTTFETFPFPQCLTPATLTKNSEDDPHSQAIAVAAKRLDELRNSWLNPDDLITREPELSPCYPDRILPKDAQAAIALKTRTLTNLYNQRPQWLVDAHRDLDATVAAAYGWPSDVSDEDALAKLLEMNLGRAAVTSELGMDLGGDSEPADED